MLARLGVKADRLGASTIDRVRLVAAHRSAEVRLPFRARGLSRHRLDGALIEAAARAGARIVRETIVAVAETGGGGGEIETRGKGGLRRSEEHTSELQSLMRISYAVFCLKKK